MCIFKKLLSARILQGHSSFSLYWDCSGLRQHVVNALSSFKSLLKSNGLNEAYSDHPMQYSGYQEATEF